MDKRKEMMFWKKVLGHPVPSSSTPDKTYYVVETEKGFECTCPDYQFRKGSWIVIYEDNGVLKEMFTCKHVIKYMVHHGFKIHYAGK